MIGNLYKITNIINNKVYIGKTYVSLNTRWRRHINDALRNDGRNNKFQNAIRKYGPDNFEIKLIGQFKEGELEQKEIEYIAKYDSYHNGYNSTLGGDGNKLISIDIETEKQIIELYNKYKHLNYVADFLNIPKRNVRNILVNNGISIINASKPKKVIMYDIYWNYINKFNSIYDAYQYCISKYEDIDSHAFFREINNSFKNGSICYGHRWQLFDDLILGDMIKKLI